MPQPLRFKVSFAVPPGRKFFFQIPNGPYVETECSWGAIDSEVRRKIADLGLPEIPNLRAEIEDYMCRNLPDGFCTGKSSANLVTYSSVVGASSKIVSEAYKNGKFGHVMPDRIDERAAACRGCKSHSMALCLSCVGFFVDFDRYLSGRGTPHDKTLRVCRACKGAIPLLLHVDADAMPEAGYDESCWVLKERQDAAKR